MNFKRQSIRLKNYDYSLEGYYFITICTHNRECLFEQFQILKDIVNNEWQNIPNKFLNVIIDQFCIMPNHIHGIIGM